MYLYLDNLSSFTFLDDSLLDQSHFLTNVLLGKLKCQNYRFRGIPKKTLNEITNNTKKATREKTETEMNRSHNIVLENVRDLVFFAKI